MHPRNIEHLVTLFESPEVSQAFATLRAAIKVRGDLPLGSEGLLIEYTPSHFVATRFLIDHDDSYCHTTIALQPNQNQAAAILWGVRVGNEYYAAQVAPHDTVSFLATQADQTEWQIGIRLGGSFVGPLSILPAPTEQQ